MSKKITVGYKYLLGMHMILCHALDKITKIEVDGKTAWEGLTTGGRITVNAPELFGGESREGGVGGPVLPFFPSASQGEVDIEMGSPSQGRNDYLQSQLGTDIPAYRGVVGVVLRRVYLGMNPYLKRWAFWGTRTNVRHGGQVQWYLAKAAIGNDMNPAHIVRECLTDPDWGMGYPETDIDDTAFTAAADQLYTEGFGLSLLWDRSAQLDEFIGTVLKHIDGALYVDRSSGKFVLKLARGGYDINTLLVLDESSVERVSDFKRNTLGELTNSVTVVYWDGTTGKNNSITVQDIALASRQGSTVGTTVQYPGITVGELASQVASRDLKALSTPLASATLYANRKAAGLNIGDVFAFSWPRFGLTLTAMRVTNVELGNLKSNLVKLTVVEDVFSLSAAIYAPPPPSEWSSPNSLPAPCPYRAVIESPYWELVQRLGEVAAQSQVASAGFLGATGVRPSSDAINAKIYSNTTGTFEEAGTVDFCPTAVLMADVNFNSKVWAIGSGVDLTGVRLGSYAKVGDEYVEVESLSDTSITVGRGVLDTVPTSHLAGDRLLFIDDFLETDGIEYTTGETAHIKLLPVTSRGTLAIASATEDNVTMASRAARPYPPGLLRLNSIAYPDAVRGDQDLVVGWAHRDRLQQTATLVDTEAGSIGPEAGTTYTLIFQSPLDTTRFTASGIAGAGRTLTLAEMGAYYGRVAVRLYSQRDGLNSLQSHVFVFTRAGYGTAYGYAYGGA